MDFMGVGAAEAALVLLVTMLVVGPQRFPEIAREGGRWYRMARRYANEVMSDVRGAMKELEEEVQAPAQDLRGLREIRDDLGATLRDAGGDVDAIGSQTREVVRDLGAEPATPSGEPERG
jgi:sec-independent protein translocase protein TatB